MIDTAIAELASVVGTAAACAAVGRSRATHYRHHCHRPPPRRDRVRAAQFQPRALSVAERKEVLRVLHDPDHVDEAPATVYAKLLDAGVHLASVSTMYRILGAEGEVAERRRQATHPPRSSRSCWPAGRTRSGHGTSPSCSARPSGPGSTCMWSSTSTAGMCLAGCWPGPSEPSWPSGCRPTPSPSRPWPRAVDDPCRPGRLDGLQAGRVPAGRSGRHQAPFPAALFQRQSLQRGAVQDAEVSARVPHRFGSYEDALWFCRRCFAWYNDEHRHSGIGFHTPADVHYGRAEQVRAERARVLEMASAAHPERFVRKPPAPPKLPTVAWINQPKKETPSTTNP